MVRETREQWREKQKTKAILKIMKAISDGKPHPYKELTEVSDLSRATLSLRLNELVEKGDVVRTEDKSKKFPYPVSYQLNKPIPALQIFQGELFQVLGVAEKNFRETQNPLGFFTIMNEFLNLNFLSLIPLIRNAKKLTMLTTKGKEQENKELAFIVDGLIDIYLNPTVVAFAETFAETVLNYGVEIDSELLMQELKERILSTQKEEQLT